jgi:hypothetical protein
MKVVRGEFNDPALVCVQLANKLNSYTGTVRTMLTTLTNDIVDVVCVCVCVGFTNEDHAVVLKGR